MKIELLIAEIGSTTTIVNAFNGVKGNDPKYVGSGFAATSVEKGDVRIGLEQATENLAKSLQTDKIEYCEMFATSSAAGGLKMTVHGLVYDMTVKAAKEAALGAGGVICHATAGKLNEYDLADIEEIQPKLILLAGGTDYGERETQIHNAMMLCKLKIKPPVIYAGNVQCVRQIESIFQESGIKCYIVENVYPKLDLLNIEPTRKIIHEVFTEHIVKAQGMEHIRERVSGAIIPTPGAVMEATQLLYKAIGDCVTIDIGGATTDVHSATEGSDEIAAISLYPEPKFKRTVEGDLGVYVNAKSVAKLFDERRIKQTGLDIEKCLKEIKPLPKSEDEINFVTELAIMAGETAIKRHVGQLRTIYGSNGRQVYAEGKDLSKIKYIIATGGALTKLKSRDKIMQKLADVNVNGSMLYPKIESVKILYDNDYIMASVGVMSKTYPEAAIKLLKKSLNID
ncbi:MAG: GlmL-related ornithine degradation protein [Clostridia bacterium]